MRREQDILGEVELDEDIVWGIHTERACANFNLHYSATKPILLRGIILVKLAAAQTYQKLGIRPQIYQAIEAVCKDLLEDGTQEYFPVNALQGGAGTSTNMNVNEVLCNLALRKLGKRAGEYDCIHPLDDVNRGQSTNDVYPTGLRIAAIFLLRELSEECSQLQEALQGKEQEFADIQKLGRTELMDAVPVTLGEEFGAYAQAIDMLIANAASRGEFELNAFLPAIADALLESLELLSDAVRIFHIRAVETVQAVPKQCEIHVKTSSAFAADYIGKLGYDRVNQVLKEYEPTEARKQLEKECQAQKREQ